MLTDELYEQAKANGYFVMDFDWREPLNVSLQWCEDVKNTDVLGEFEAVAASKNPASKTCFIEGMDHTFNVFAEEDLHSLYQAVDETGKFFSETLR